MKVYGLTGGIGMGKSTAARLLRERGVPVADTDLIARELVEPGQPALAEITSAFGREIIADDGRLRREELGRIIFADSAARRKLEAILHPRIRAIWRGQIDRWRSEGVARAVVDIPLLFETEAQEHFDAIICIACSATTQLKRLLGRGWNQEQIEQRLAAQWPIGKKMDHANYVVWTEAGFDVDAAQIDRIIV